MPLNLDTTLDLLHRSASYAITSALTPRKGGGGRAGGAPKVPKPRPKVSIGKIAGIAIGAAAALIFGGVAVCWHVAFLFRQCKIRKNTKRDDRLMQIGDEEALRPEDGVSEHARREWVEAGYRGAEMGGGGYAGR
ncbi:hypothetical protein FB567DRAFT_580967 [Paraphoma chrysanthemicola]|uniref:Uncharacterized protein n=1 Tax=Paraphoma chrysanthemicola TaxID=798071 RepID=A0A8K0R5S2_9PLEO|nr:hypothetical protein FB567DRAFT_580967 [Paraphoma chrysanthemicola]